MNNPKIELLSETIFKILYSQVHKQNETSHMFVKNAIADSIYKQCPRSNFSGKISFTAKEALKSQEITRNRLCKEHFIPRVKTALDVINLFDYKISNSQVTNTEITFEISNLLEKGSKVNLVLSEENNALAQYQKDHSKTPEEVYALAGIQLVDDEIIPRYKYRYDNQLYQFQTEIMQSLNISKSKIKKMIQEGLIEVGNF